MSGRPVAALALLLVVPLLLLAPAAPAQACSCAADTVRGYAASADVVATGRVTGVSSGWFGLVDHVTLEVRADRVYSGELGPDVEVVTAGPSSGCGLGIEDEGSYVLFLAREGDDLTTGLCSGTQRRTKRTVAAVERILGEGVPAPESEPGGPSAGELIALAALVGTGGVVGVRRWRGARRTS